ncbi:voltage-gated potassium channel [Paraliobacillus sp. PM-2]|uniref:potassium channel family protein n=1 Tax=Paraliobacillus sp. PM-2 TaxID=1462524 RepID=UPI00061BEBCA|nr:potassium channel family protein [Paraliobacillus sp. PM-2]CQR48213.1 voltage-gated potassium channel [Paraliobacillus sp. PM-2]
MYLYKFMTFYFRLPVFIRLLLTVSILMFLFGFIIHLIEPAHFPSVFEGIWWAFVTGSTVGYGDFVPLSPLGKVIGILLILAGGGLVTFYMATVSSATIKREEEMAKGNTAFKGKNHIIFIGWNERTRQLLDMMQTYHKKEPFVLIDHSLKQFSHKEHACHFVRGDPTSDETLQKANIKNAAYAIITADPAKKEQQADQTSILTTVAIKGNNPDIHVVTEILTKEQVSNAKRAGATTVIRSNDFMGTLFFQEIFRVSTEEPFEFLLQILATQQFSSIKIPTNLVGQTFLEASTSYVSAERLLIGIIRQDDIMINPSFHTHLEKDDQLLLLNPMS